MIWWEFLSEAFLLLSLWFFFLLLLLLLVFCIACSFEPFVFSFLLRHPHTYTLTSFTHPLTSLTSFIHSFIHSPAHSLTHSLTHSLFHSLPHYPLTLTHSLTSTHSFTHPSPYPISQHPRWSRRKFSAPSCAPCLSARQRKPSLWQTTPATAW